MRLGAGLTQTDLAERLDWPQNRVSRLETAAQLATADDVRRWASACGARGEEERLLGLLDDAAARYTSFEQSLTGEGGVAGQQAAIEAVWRSATDVYQFMPGILPGMLQTRGYMRESLHVPMAMPLFGADDAAIEDLVDARQHRQLILTEPGSPRVHIVILESTLRTMYTSTAAMAGQLRQLELLLAGKGLPGLELAIIPSRQVLPAVAHTGFVVFDDAFVSIETVTGEVEYRQPAAVANYRTCWDMLRAVAMTGEDAAGLVRAAIAYLS